MTALDQQRVAEWIGDAFAILCVRQSGLSASERNLRLGFEALLRRLRIPPLGVVTKVPPGPFRRSRATPADLRHIIKALDSCLAVFKRYGGILTPAQLATQQLVEETRRHAKQELEARRHGRKAALVAV